MRGKELEAALQSVERHGEGCWELAINVAAAMQQNPRLEVDGLIPDGPDHVIFFRWRDDDFETSYRLRIDMTIDSD
jgi:hypothetical protein